MSASPPAASGGASSIQFSWSGLPATMVDNVHGSVARDMIAGGELRFSTSMGYSPAASCHRLAYDSQRIAAWERALNRAQSIREKLGGTANMHEPFPQEQKGMHWWTYWELRRLHDEADAHSWPGWIRRWKMPSRVKA